MELNSLYSLTVPVLLTCIFTRSYLFSELVSGSFSTGCCYSCAARCQGWYYSWKVRHALLNNIYLLDFKLVFTIFKTKLKSHLYIIRFLEQVDFTSRLECPTCTHVRICTNVCNSEQFQCNYARDCIAILQYNWSQV